MVKDACVLGASAVELMAETVPDTRGQTGDTAALGPLGVCNRAGFAASFRAAQRTPETANLVWDLTMALFEEGALERHGQPGGAQGQPFGCEGFVVVRTVGPGHSGKATGGMEIFVDIEGVVGFVQRPVFGWAPQVGFCLRHEREEVSGIALVKGLGEIRQHELAIAVDFGGDDA